MAATGNRPVDIAGKRFGKLTALRFFDRSASHTRWLFRCDCGTETPMFKSNVMRGQIKTCTACGHKRQSKAVFKHGKSHDLVYQIFHAAKQRCQNRKDRRFHDYGGRGIQFRFHSFADFCAAIGPRPEGMTLDRIDNDGHYEAGNVRWATPKQQAGSRRPKKTITA